jgi:hypothetical protein
VIYYGGGYDDTWVVSGYITAGIWRKNPNWNLFTTRDVYVYENTYGSGGGLQTVNWGLYDTFALGPGVTDFGVTIEGHDGYGCSLNYLAVSYTSQASSSERSATPGGETCNATVRP